MLGAVIEFRPISLSTVLRGEQQIKTKIPEGRKKTFQIVYQF